MGRIQEHSNIIYTWIEFLTRVIHYMIQFFSLTTEGINCTVLRREHPLTIREAVKSENREIGRQHEDVQDSKVGDQKVGWRSQFLHFEEEK